MHYIEIDLPLETRIKKRDFLRNKFYVTTESSDRQHVSAQKICKYIEQVHGIQLPENFTQKLLEAHRTFFSNYSFYMTYNHVDAIITACEIWRDYIDNHQFEQLVYGELISFAQIHTSVIQAPKIQSVQGILLEKCPSIRFATIVNKNGHVVACA